MRRRKSRWEIRREKAVLGDLAEWPLSTTLGIAEHLRLDPNQVGRTLDVLLAERRITDHWIVIPVGEQLPALGLMRTHKQVCHWSLPSFDTQLDALNADQPDEERS